MAVNPTTNTIYAANSGSANVTVINGATNSTVTVNAGANPVAMAVDAVTNKIYVADEGDGVNPGLLTVIDGVTPARTDQ